ncbi:hypothetical protein C7M61_003753 [Candidozyma pseudohaemuli]|uniref:Gti1/Pac2 family protein n=1 Tax=Candidozyma pseudohaemuli TaxID=418784 RepID=A0A2P7YLR4_9ASCO|nr:hypothetical protein C7M61_003753 [[Candida] pseudohaemulonii]PSK36889.1 hypothetical protein C7M61_003753 [[Candida] pseudohaemulonii]
MAQKGEAPDEKKDFSRDFQAERFPRDFPSIRKLSRLQETSKLQETSTERLSRRDFQASRDFYRKTFKTPRDFQGTRDFHRKTSKRLLQNRRLPQKALTAFTTFRSFTASTTFTALSAFNRKADLPQIVPMMTLVPTYTGYIGSTRDAVLIIQGVLSKEFACVHRRPHSRERADLIRLGNVFVFIEEQLGIKRWTDGIAWSPSRILGRFLVYRELDKLLHDDRRKRKRNLEPSMLQRSLASDLLDRAPTLQHFQQFQQPFVTLPLQHKDPHMTVTRLDHGLIKKTLSVSTVVKENDKELRQTVHLISYYLAYDVLLGRLVRPSQSNLQYMPVNPDLWAAIQKSTLGGKIPIEDEAHYFLDANYQLQNMLVLSQPERKVSPATDPKHYFQPYAQPVNYLPFPKVPLPSPYSDAPARHVKEEEPIEHKMPPHPVPPIHMPQQDPVPEQMYYGAYSHQMPLQYYNGPGLLNPTAGEQYQMANPPGTQPLPPYQQFYNQGYQYAVPERVPAREGYQEDYMWKETL